ncbi:DNA-binding CsgD family transcriptional regulator/tetratricopeptide (TPR) repeat protein [Phycicoccus badiiscoriae]|uniref:DNA-binding CsgD family transcriptional regulator/tetratricopeptide (TPR) repeat protein n=1 Tax=Pedococcus badiiscoriae TaxID=642776 RepID=A0A852WNH7_9MICO|nr:DNA-binding CsgD family transcriptional regulator/tetratricopeptide (TPR) repeat protein [Pedococcus badiiscoriae]
MGFERSSAGLFVGRDAEATRLAALLGLDAGLDARSGTGMVLLSGDAGIGKTRILAEVAARARAQGWSVLVGHCLGEAGQSLPYLPFIEVLGRLESTSPELLDRVVTAHPGLARLVPSRRAEPHPDDPADAAVDRGDLVEAVHGALDDLASDGPILLVVEDVHWADQSSRDLLTLLFTRGFSRRVSIVASYRSDDLHRRHPLRNTLAHWSRLAEVERLDLAPLPDDAVRQLVRGLQARPLAEAQVRQVVERAEGNAFFAEELVAATSLGGSGLAEDLSRLLLVRFDQLDTAGQHVVRVASAAGRHVSHRLLAEVAGLGEAELDAGLRDAVEHHVLVPTDSGGYAFRHALLGETVYDDLLPGERVRAHERYAAALGQDRSLGTWAELARHASAAGRREQAREASVRAGDSAMRMAGPEEAFRHFQNALSLMPETDPESDAVTLRAATAATAVGHALKALELLEERLARRPVDADPAGRAELLAALATTARITESTLDTLAATKEGLGLLDEVEEDHLQTRARLLAARVQALADRGRDGEAIAAVQESVAAAEAAGLRDLADEVRVVEARILERAGDPETSRATLERIIATSRTPGDPAEVRAYHHLGWLHHRAGRLDEAVEVYRKGVERARGAGRPWAPYAFDGRLLAGIAAYERGRWSEALDILDVSREVPPEPARSLLTGARMYVAAARGDFSAVAGLDVSRPWWEQEGLVSLLAGSAAIDLYGHADDLASAMRVHDEVVEVLNRVWYPLFQGQLRLDALLLGQLGSHIQRVPSSERPALLARGAELADSATQVWDEAITRPGNDGPESTAWLARAAAEALRLRWLGGEEVDPVRMVEAWRAAVDAFDVYGHPYESARSRARLGIFLKSTGDPRGSDELKAALEVAQRLGAEPLRAEIRLGGGVRSTPRHSSRQGEALTTREAEILALVALGRSNRQIGTQLFISAKTASVHVSNIIAKLGVTGRGEAVAVARERGLLD